MSILNLERLSAKSIAEELYDPARLGVVALSSFLKDNFRLKLRDELISIGESYVEQPLQVDKVYQDLSTYTLTEEDDAHLDERFPSILELRKGFIGFWQSVLFAGECREGGYNETEAIRYDNGSTGITYHRDSLKCRNLIGVFIVEGGGRFFAAKSREGLEKKQFEASPGSLILIRAPRTGKEDERPFHQVEEIVGERYVLSFRQRKVG